jgi:hypothetical protein
MKNSNIPEYDDLREFCDTLRETDIMCRKCAMELKNKIGIVSKVSSDKWGFTAGILSPPDMEFHSSCVIRLLALAKGLF